MPLSGEVARDDRDGIRRRNRARSRCGGLEGPVAVAQKHVDGISVKESVLATARSVRPLFRKSPATSDMGTEGNRLAERDRGALVNVPSPLPRSTVTASMYGSATARSRCPLLVKLPATIASGKLIGFVGIAGFKSGIVCPR